MGFLKNFSTGVYFNFEKLMYSTRVDGFDGPFPPDLASLTLSVLCRVTPEVWSSES